MKKIFLIIFLLFVSSTCERDWDNIFDTDEDLSNAPKILQTNLDENRNISIIINYAYSDSSTIQLERKSAGGFEKIPFLKATQTTLIDTSYDKEINHTFVYRVSVMKDKYRSFYSNEKQFIYSSSGLMQPTNLIAVSVELQGIRLEWEDNSNYEDGYNIEKDEGTGYQALTTVSSNIESYFDAISGSPATPMILNYRIRAYNEELESDWVNISNVYSGLGSPTNLIIISNSAANFIIEWQDNSSIETGYSIERMKDGTAFEIIGGVNANITRYSDILSELGEYIYRVRAKNNDYYSSYSNEVSYEITSLLPIEGLVAYYPFNGNADDLSPNNNHGIVNGPELANDRFDSENTAYRFDGTNDYIEVGHNTSLNLTTALSVSVWIKTSKQKQSYFIEKDVFNSYAVGISTNANFKIWLNGGEGVEVQYSYWDEWKNLVVTYDNSAGEVKHYIDGSIVKTSPYSNAINTTTKNLQIGRRLPSNYYFEGIIDDLRIYNRAISQEEVLALYHEGDWDN